MDSRIRVTTCKTGNKRLLGEVFESKPIKRGGKKSIWTAQEIIRILKHLYKCLSPATPTTTTPLLLHPLPQIHMSHGNSITWTKHK